MVQEVAEVKEPVKPKVEEEVPPVAPEPKETKIPEVQKEEIPVEETAKPVQVTEEVITKPLQQMPPVVKPQEEEELIKAKADTLKGLTVMGKIELPDKPKKRIISQSPLLMTKTKRNLKESVKGLESLVRKGNLLFRQEDPLRLRQVQEHHLETADQVMPIDLEMLIVIITTETKTLRSQL